MSHTPETIPLRSILEFDDCPELAEIVQMFVDEMPERIKKIVSEFQDREWEKLSQSAHQLKGSAGSYGFQEISPAAGTVEDLIRKHSSEEEIREAVEYLISLCERLE